jgi:hypothetical protein
MKFYAFLVEQTGRNDQVGCFSRLIEESRKRPDKELSYGAWEEWLLLRGADAEAMAAFRRAWLESIGSVVDLGQYRNKGTKKIINERETR